MLVCFDCRQPVDDVEAPCRNCGSEARAEINDRGTVVSFSAACAVPCSSCGEVGDDLLFRRFRRVIGMVVLDRIYTLAGYYCAACRRAQFWRHLGLTLLLGWWGVLALLVRNPYAIAVNVKALFSPPRTPERYGAVSLEQIEPRPNLAARSGG